MNSERIDTIQSECAERMAARGRGAQTMAAEVIGCDRRQLSGWLGGKNAMSEDRVRALVEWLGGRYVAAAAEWCAEGTEMRINGSAVRVSYRTSDRQDYLRVTEDGRIWLDTGDVRCSHVGDCPRDPNTGRMITGRDSVLRAANM